MKPRPFALERFFAEHEFTARHLLCASDPESMTIGDLLGLEPGAREGLDRVWLGYTEAPGAPALRQAVARTYDGIDQKQVLIHSGAEEPIFSFMNVALGPGDHVIVQFPCYQSHEEVARAAGARVTRWTARRENGWALDPDELEGLIEPATRALVLCLPNNPTGWIPERSRLERIVEISRRHGLYVFVDEVYRGMEFDPATRVSAICELYEKGVSLGAVSKTHGLPGLRIGWIATRDEALFEGMATFKDYLTIANAAPSEYLALLALRHQDRLIERTLGTIRRNLGLLDDFFQRRQDILAWHRPKAGTIGFPWLISGSSRAFCDRLLRDTGVLLLPSHLLEFGDANMRIGFGRRNMAEVLSILDDWLSTRQLAAE